MKYDGKYFLKKQQKEKRKREIKKWRKGEMEKWRNRQKLKFCDSVKCEAGGPPSGPPPPPPPPPSPSGPSGAPPLSCCWETACVMSWGNQESQDKEEEPINTQKWRNQPRKKQLRKFETNSSGIKRKKFLNFIRGNLKSGKILHCYFNATRNTTSAGRGGGEGGGVGGGANWKMQRHGTNPIQFPFNSYWIFVVDHWEMWNDTCRMLPTFYLDATGGRGGIEEELRRNWGRCCWRGFHHGVPSSSPAVGAATTGNISLCCCHYTCIYDFIQFRFHSVEAISIGISIASRFPSVDVVCLFTGLWISWLIIHLFLFLSLSLYVMLRNRSILSALPEMLQMWRDGFRSHLHIRLHPRTHGGLLFTAFLGP